ncbi:MAG: hypothetical protein M3N93_09335 [Acidobacteriota bacterium]|nr:hypothetical protein [Acidobacteriota bacterium]
MLPEKLRSLFRRDSDPVAQTSGHSGKVSGLSARSVSATARTGKSGKKEPPQTRQSRGLEQFFFNIRDVVGLSILDCAGANQDNINFLINLGHKVYSQDLVRNLDEAFDCDLGEQTNPSRIDYFLRQNFEYPPDTLDGVLLWDSLQFMSPALLNATVDRLYEVMQPKSYLLAFFTATERAGEVPSHSFRIADNKTLVLTERDMRPAGHVFNNRNLEKLFGKFESVKFFLTRESLREVIVRR